MCQPMKALPPPNMNAKPHAQWRSPQTQVSKTHSTSTLTVSRFRQKPASSMVKPACMPNTRNAPSSTQPVLTGLMTGFLAMSIRSAGITGVAADVGIGGADFEQIPRELERDDQHR